MILQYLKAYRPVSNNYGTLYIVATPIGNLNDMSFRAVETLQTVDYIAVEDSRHSSRLLKHFHITTPYLVLHDFNEVQQSKKLIHKLQQGQHIALISDAGTPLISDPGYRLVSLAQEHNIKVSPIPGASALTASLSVAGLATDRFIFEGFLPSKDQARENYLHNLKMESRTLVFYEAPHRILACFASLIKVFGEQRPACLLRELTKQYEQVIRGTLLEIQQQINAPQAVLKGEMVIVLAGAEEQSTEQQRLHEAVQMAEILSEVVSTKQAAALAARICQVRKNPIYQALIGK